MSKIKTILKGGAMAVLMTVLVAVPTFAAACDNGEFEGLSIGADTNYPIKCSGITITTDSGNESIYGKTSADCAKAASLAANPDGCEVRSLNSTIQLIINMIIFAIGLIAVVMVILGGIQYSTSQGDSGKVKKAKDTIMYGIIGLVVAILAFAIVNFVLSSII
ncbi:MAG: pilin [Candidatus Saccharimonadales bacterium]